MLSKEYVDQKLIKIRELMLDVIDENIKQLKKWGIQKHNLYVWYAILMEEVGELGKAILENECGKKDAKNIKIEAISIATLSLKIAEMIEDK